jgi:GDP-D-mannose dehydratase
MKKPLITGITGRDEAHLAKLLLETGYELHGAITSIRSDVLGTLHK